MRKCWGVAVIAAWIALSPNLRAQSETDYYDDAIGLMGQHKYVEAEAAFRKSIHADPRYREAWQGLASALKAQGKDAVAVERMAAAAPAARAGAAPPLTADQDAALSASADDAAKVADDEAELAKLQKQLDALKAQRAADRAKRNAGNHIDHTPPPPPPLPSAVNASAAPAMGTTPAAQAPPVATPPAAAPAAVPMQPLASSSLVNTNAAGQPALMDKSGKPIDGVPLSKHNKDIFSPSIAVGRDGVIHVAFCEGQAVAPYAYFVYYRSSSDGGVTWSETKNLSEIVPDNPISRCQVLVDSANRVYVVYRCDYQPGGAINPVPNYNVAGNRYNLVYRVLEGGRWSKQIQISHPTDPQKQNDGMATYCAGVDPRGAVQLMWNTAQYPYHPQWFNGQPLYDGRSLIFTATLDGSKPPKAREAYHCPIKPVTYNAAFQKTDDFDVIDGYFDANGQPHLVTSVYDSEIRQNGVNMQLVEGGRQTPIVNLPGGASQVWLSRPTLLLDAQGRQHMIAIFEAGETPAVKDFPIGNADEPNVIRAAADVKGKIEGFQAFPGPGGLMIVLMQINDTGEWGESETFISTSNGGAWSPPVCVTNNKGRQAFASVNTSSQSYVAQQTRHYPLEGAAAVDEKGHLVLALIDKEVTMTVSNAFGVNIAGGDTATPVLRFVKF